MIIHHDLARAVREGLLKEITLFSQDISLEKGSHEKKHQKKHVLSRSDNIGSWVTLMLFIEKKRGSEESRSEIIRQ